MQNLAVNLRESEISEVISKARSVSNVMKSLSHETRLMILCHLAAGPKSVSDLQNLLTENQPAISQHLSRLRLEKLVVAQRDGKQMNYALAEGNTAHLIRLLYKVFCDS